MECIRIHIYCFDFEYRCSRKKVAKFKKNDLSAQVKSEDCLSVTILILILNFFVPKRDSRNSVIDNTVGVKFPCDKNLYYIEIFVIIEFLDWGSKWMKWQRYAVELVPIKRS